jgi:hypothetical protein
MSRIETGDLSPAPFCFAGLGNWMSNDIEGMKKKVSDVVMVGYGEGWVSKCRNRFVTEETILHIHRLDPITPASGSI